MPQRFKKVFSQEKDIGNIGYRFFSVLNSKWNTTLIIWSRRQSWECRGRIGRSWWWTTWFSSSTILINARIANRLGCFGSIEIGLFLKFSNILFVSNALISKPIRNLWNRDSTFSCKFFFCFFGRIWITEMRIKIFVQNFCCLLWKISSFSS